MGAKVVAIIMINRINRIVEEASTTEAAAITARTEGNSYANPMNRPAMQVEHSEQSHQDPAVEFLAKESKVSVDDVARLYENELAELEIGARVTGFIPIIAIRNVRATLRQRWTAKLA
jgi:hypothetical protein